MKDKYDIHYKAFKTKINYYLYVTFSNNIYQINRKLYKLISDYLPSNNDKLKNLINQTNAIDNTKKGSVNLIV